MLLAVILAALALLLLRPFCGLVSAGNGQSDVAGGVRAAGHVVAEHPDPGDALSGTCCATIKDGTLVKPAEPLVSWTAGGTLGTAVFAFTGLLLFAPSRNPVRILLAVPPQRSYYFRSARILR